MSFGEGDLHETVRQLREENDELRKYLREFGYDEQIANEVSRVPGSAGQLLGGMRVFGMTLNEVRAMMYRNEELESLVRYALYCLEEPSSSRFEFKRRARELGIVVGR